MTSLARLPRPSASRLAVRVTPDALRQIRGGHPWVYETSIDSLKGPTIDDGSAKPGDLAVVFDDDRRFTAIGLYDPASPIRIKVIHQGKPATVDRAFWTRHITTALATRQPLLDRNAADPATASTGYRCISGENDGFPSLVLDRYDRTLVLKLYSTIWVPHLADLVPAIEDVFHPDALVLRLARNIDQPGLCGLEEGDALIGVSPSDPVLFQENGLTFEADVVHGQKTGHFLDQRDNRAYVRRLADGRRVLDMFAATGGFSVHAAAGGAHEVVAVDLSEPTLAAASRNMQHNIGLAEVAACTFRPMVGDAFEVMNRLARNGERFDMVIIDPPSFTPRQASVDRALQQYALLTEKGVKLVRPGGVLVQASCSSRVAADEFFTTVSHSAAQAGRPLDELRRSGHPLDHPVAFAQGRYLKAVFANVP
ncbi:MAG: class I SAM-dependent methyltransferase [Actinomycetota bacterium]|nr:class I SAM-dependent methyltransferase [Actinomycetota bacterium]